LRSSLLEPGNVLTVNQRLWPRRVNDRRRRSVPDTGRGLRRCRRARPRSRLSPAAAKPRPVGVRSRSDRAPADAGSAVLAFEIDEGTEHRRTIRAMLAAYRRPLAIGPNWHLLVVVPKPIRAAWMVRVAALGHGSSRAPISRATPWMPCSDHSTQYSPPVPYGRCSGRRGGCYPPPSGPVPGSSSLRPAVGRQRTAPSLLGRRPGIQVARTVSRSGLAANRASPHGDVPRVAPRTQAERARVTLPTGLGWVLMPQRLLSSFHNPS
jgi:hypothetical protein